MTCQYCGGKGKERRMSFAQCGDYECRDDFQAHADRVQRDMVEIRGAGLSKLLPNMN